MYSIELIRKQSNFNPLIVQRKYSVIYSAYGQRILGIDQRI